MKSLKTKNRISYSCDECGLIITGKKASSLKNNMRKSSRTNGFCSKKCCSKFKMKNTFYDCDCCGDRIYGRKAGRILNRKSTGSRHGFCSNKCQRAYRRRNHIKPLVVFECNQCHTLFKEYGWRRKFKLKFCNRKCKTIFTNSRIGTKLASCVDCGGVVEIGLHQHYKNALCLSCSLIGNIKTYRAKCKFRFNVHDFPNDFNLNLIKKFGWYNRHRNKNGVSRDHMYSIKDGYRNKISFLILAHPTNCELVLQKDNRKKYYNSSITIAVLKKRIAIWNSSH